MARQEGEIKIRGKIGDLSFYKTSADGFLARRKGGVTAERIKNDPNFQRTRENIVEFGRAGHAAKVFRTALREVIRQIADSRSTSRLTKLMSQVIKSDTKNLRGKRSVTAGDLLLLQGFEFNDKAPFTGTFVAPFAVAMDRASGNLSIAIPEFVKSAMISSPPGATHFRLIVLGMAVDFAAESASVAKAVSADTELGPQAEPAMTLQVAVPGGTTHPLFLLAGIQFFQRVNGLNYLLTNGSFDALKIVGVNVAV